MSNAAQPERNRTLAIIALATVGIAVLMNVLLLARGKPVEWYSWAFLVALACSICSMTMRRSALQNALLVLGFVCALAGLYGVVRH